MGCGNMRWLWDECTSAWQWRGRLLLWQKQSWEVDPHVRKRCHRKVALVWLAHLPTRHAPAAVRCQRVRREVHPELIRHFQPENYVLSVARNIPSPNSCVCL